MTRETGAAHRPTDSNKTQLKLQFGFTRKYLRQQSYHSLYYLLYCDVLWSKYLVQLVFYDQMN
jgi:hypothetical protein